MKALILIGAAMALCFVFGLVVGLVISPATDPGPMTVGRVVLTFLATVLCMAALVAGMLLTTRP